MKLNPPPHPDEVEFHRKAISSTEGGFIPTARTDLVEKSHLLSQMAFFLAGAEGLGLDATTQSRAFDFAFATRLGQSRL